MVEAGKGVSKATIPPVWFISYNRKGMREFGVGSVRALSTLYSTLINGPGVVKMGFSKICTKIFLFSCAYRPKTSKLYEIRRTHLVRVAWLLKDPLIAYIILKSSLILSLFFRIGRQ